MVANALQKIHVLASNIFQEIHVSIVSMVTMDQHVALRVQEVQQILVLGSVNVRKDQRELENVLVKAESLETLVTCVQQIISGRIVNRLVRLVEVQVLLVLDMEYVMLEHQCRQEIALAPKAGMETIGKFVCCWVFFLFSFFHKS